jgi:MYXO-CTERM domain-containing protein
VSGNITGAQTLTLGTATTLVGSTSSLKLSGNNSGFTGNVVVNNGNLIITNSDSLGTGTKTVQVLVNSTGVASLSLDGSAGDIILPSSMSFTTSLGGVGAGIVNVAGNNTINGNFSMTGGNGATQFVSNGGSLTLAGGITASTTGRAVFLQGTGAGEVSGSISNGLTVNLPVTKDGAGTWTVSGSNSYTGTTTVNAGKLVIDGNISTSSLTTVNTNGTLGGSGTVGALTVAGGTVGPGNSPGVLDVAGNYTQTSGTLAVELNGTTLGTQYDQLNVTGTITLGGLLTAAVGYTPVNGDLLFILANDGVEAISGSFSGMADLSTVTFGGFDWRISYKADSVGNTLTGGNDVALMAVPEPNAAMLVGGLGMLALLRRRRDG